MPIERRIREGAERNAGVLDPDVDRFLDSVVHKTRRRKAIHRSLTATATVALVVVTVILGPSVLDRIGSSGGTVPGSNPTPSVTPGVALAYAMVAAGFFAVGKYGTSGLSVSHREMPMAAPAE